MSEWESPSDPPANRNHRSPLNQLWVALHNWHSVWDSGRLTCGAPRRGREDTEERHCDLPSTDGDLRFGTQGRGK